ncbi:aspartic proteinase nepenthesin-1-like [Oryza brachyantha]|uniref:Peptidase A1 domain-containing protein n=1 Tax=Oryza brachyantha TaxID=4533 RepID=J3N4H2_ORYBR|nr:aspartic proteinase nepenthesin-1-like [Oryza brachyantha]
MGRPVTASLVLCLISLATCSLSTRADGLWRGLEQAAMRGRLLADAAAPGGGVVPIHMWGDGYVANITIGTPPQPASAIIDINGYSVWTQCKQCSSCFKQELPLFDRSASSTFKPEPCSSARCKSVPTAKCTGDGMCGYEDEYTSGIGGTDTFTIGTATASLAFGCVLASDYNTLGGPSGFIGLGRAPWSLVSQMNLTRFSYCLAPHETGKNSKLFLGSSAKLAAGGNGTSTPFVKTPPDDYFSDYMLQLEGINAGDVAYKPQNDSTVIVSTFWPVSFLVDSAYQAIEKAVTAALGAPMEKPPKPFDLCFKKAKISDAPDVVFMFQGGAALTVPPSKYLLGNNTACLSIWRSARLNLTDGISILGSFQQENTHLLFDLKEGTLSFEPADCSSLN